MSESKFKNFTVVTHIIYLQISVSNIFSFLKKQKNPTVTITPPFAVNENIAMQSSVDKIFES